MISRNALQPRRRLLRVALLCTFVPCAVNRVHETPAFADDTRSPARLAASNTRAPFCYVEGGAREWPVLAHQLGKHQSVSLLAQLDGKRLAQGDRLRFSHLNVSFTPQGKLRIVSDHSNEKEKGVSFALTIQLRTADAVDEEQTISVRAAPPGRPISYLADLGDDIIVTFLNNQTKQFRPIDKGSFDQYFRRLQAHGVSRLIVWQTPFPYMADPENYSEEDWQRTERQTRAIVENDELTDILTASTGKLATWTWQRALISLRLTRDFGPMFTKSASEHGIRLTASFRPFEPALTKYYEVPTFDSDGHYLWGFLPLASPVVNYHAQSVCFANHRVILEEMVHADAAEPERIEFSGVKNAALLAERFRQGKSDVELVASHFPPIAEGSFVLVRDRQAGFSLKRYRAVSQLARSKRVRLTGYELSSPVDGTLHITSLKVPSGYRYLILARAGESAEVIEMSVKRPIVLRSRAGSRLGRVNVYRALPESDADGPMTRIAGISATGEYRTTFQTIENSIDRIGKEPTFERLADSELVFDLGADWSVEMLDFERPAARRMAVKQLKSLLHYPAFDEILINTRSHCQLAASTVDGVDGVRPMRHYRLHGKNYVHLGIDRAFAPMSLANSDTISALAADPSTIEQLTTWQPGAWSYDEPCQLANSPYAWRYHRNRAVASGVRMLLTDLENEFPGVRIRAVIPPSEAVTRHVRKGLETMPKPDGGVYGRDYYRHIRGSLNHIPAIGEGMAMVDLSGLSVEPVFLGVRFAPEPGPFGLYLDECLSDMADNRGSSYRGPRSFFYEAQETLRTKDHPAWRTRRERIIREALAHKQEINEVILYEAADWLYHLPLSDADLCGHGFLDRSSEAVAE